MCRLDKLKFVIRSEKLVHQRCYRVTTVRWVGSFDRVGIPRTVSWASARLLRAYSLKCPVSEGIYAAGSWLFISALPRQRILTGRYHYGRERAKTCQYIGGGWGCEVSCGGHHRPRGKTTTGSALDGAVFDIAQILAYQVHNMSRSQLYLGFGHFGRLPSFFGQ